MVHFGIASRASIRLRQASHCDSRLTPTPGSLRLPVHSDSRITPIPGSLRFPVHCDSRFTAIPGLLRFPVYFDSTVGAPSGAMPFCTFRTSASSSLRMQGPSDLALASLRASLRGARCGHLVPSFHSPAASESLSLAWPRESNQREGHPDAAVSGHPALRLRAATPGLADSPSLDWQPTGSHPCEPPPDRVRGRLFGPCLRHCATA